MYSGEQLCLDLEEWRDIPDYEEYYQASSWGRIRSVDRYTTGPYGSTVLRKGRIRKLGHNKTTGYLCVVLSVNGVHYSRDVHRLIANTFIPNPNNLPCVDHINCDRHDNRVSNLRWVTQQDNVLHSIEAGNYDVNRQSSYINRKDVRENNLAVLRKPVVRNDGMRFASISEAAQVTGCSRRAIQLVLSGENDTCKGFTFKYE